MPETTVFDHYEVLRREDGSLFELGRGAMGITYKAFDTSLRCPVALKVINAASIHSDVARQRFVREARSAASLRHRHVASVFHLGVEGDTYFYAMEFIEGETVESLVRRLGPFHPILALRITVQVARALNAAQRHQLVHRDIKPSNLMLVREDEELVVKVIDFGLAKTSNAADMTVHDSTPSVGGFVGTPHFASPEQLDELDLDVRSDIYSLGVTLWYMLAGQPPFTGTLAQVMNQHLHDVPPLKQLPDGLPECSRDALLKMMAKRPGQRQQTPMELRSELEGCIEAMKAANPAEANLDADVVLIPATGMTGGAVLKNKGFYPGAFVGNRYELLRDLGENNSGWAFYAEDLRDDSRLRLIVLQADWVTDTAALTQLEHEVEKLCGVQHPNILRVLGMERTSEASFITMEWTEGFSLLELLRCRQEIDADETLLLLRQIAPAIDEAMTRGLRHVDFSLNQILIHFPDGEKEMERRLAIPVDRWPEFQVKVNPLGITREFATSDTWAGGQTIVGDLAASARRDAGATPGRHYLQSLAAVMYELLGGTLSPVMIGGLGTQPVTRYVPVAALPESGNAVLKRALDPNETYATATEFCTALEGTLAGDYRAQLLTPTTAPLAPPPGRPVAGVATETAAAGLVKSVSSMSSMNPAATYSRAPVSPKSAGRGSRVPVLGIAAACACVVAAVGLWLMNRPGPGATQETAAAGNGAASGTAGAAGNAPESAAAPTLTPVPTPIPAAPTPDPNAPLKAKLQEGEDFETAHNWPKAIEAYVDFTHSYPGVGTGVIRLEALLSSLRPSLEKMSGDEFAGIRTPVTDAANLGVTSAMEILADHIRLSAPRDAFAWYSAAAAGGSVTAITQAGLMVSNGAGVPQDYPQAASWFQWAANAGDPAGKTCLAECFLYGTGIKKDEARAIAMLQEAVGGGDLRAMNLLGTCYHRGLGTPKNYEQALKLFTRAHDAGFEDAAGNMGVLYINGDGVPRDAHKAVNLFNEGAQAGNPYCMYLLAKCLESGTGINSNEFEAEAWYRKAAQAGNPMAAAWCDGHHVLVPKATP